MLTTNYVWTDKAQLHAEANGLETRLAGTVANFAYQPLERSPITANAWLEDGYVRKAKKPLPFLNFIGKLTKEYLHADMAHFFAENGIKYKYISMKDGLMAAAIVNDDELVPVTYHNISGNLYMITEKDSPLDLLYSSAEA